MSNPFESLFGINVNDHIEKKGRFSYLSWPYAVAELLKRHPDATWRVLETDDGIPFWHTSAGFFVKVGVTVNGVERVQIHPVLDNSNRPIAEPNAFHINTSIQRCLVKAIALHGLGLYIYAGEDLPEGEKEEQPKISEDQAVELSELIAATKTDGGKFCAYFKIGDIMELAAADFERAKRMLERKANESEA